MFEKYKNLSNPEQWGDEFYNEMKELGFEMDCYQSFYSIFPHLANYASGQKDAEDAILACLEKSSVHIVGNYIFSRYRYLTHWCQRSLNKWENEYFFSKAFEILEEKFKNNKEMQ